MKQLFALAVLFASLTSSLLAQSDDPSVGPSVNPPSQPTQQQPVRKIAGSIDDISSHRLDPARYVRRFADIVEVELGPIDLSKEVILKVGGRPVPRSEYLRRGLMFGGLQEIGGRLTQVVTNREVDRLVAEGRSRDEFELDAADVDRKYNNYLEVIRMQAANSLAQSDPNATVTEEEKEQASIEAIKAFEDSIHASLGMEAFRESLVSEVRFEKVFLSLPTEPVELPEDYPKFGPDAGRSLPDDAPCPDFVNQTTWDALGMDPNTRVMRQLLISSGTTGQPIPSLFLGQVTSAIRLGVLKNAGLTWFYETDDMSPDALCKLGEDEVLASELWPLVEPTLNELDHELILREMLTMMGMRETLEAADAWLDLEETRGAYQALEDEYAQTLFPLAAIIMFQGYTDVDRYREHFAYRNAYDTWRGASLTDEEVEDHYRRSGRLFFEKGSVHADIAFVGTEAVGGFTPESFELASSLLLESFGELDTAEEWGAKTPEFRMPATRAHKGEERQYQRNQLRLRLTESYQSIFQRGYSLADDVFYHGVPGEVFGPFPMTNRRHGWGAEVNAGSWMLRVDEYSASSTLSPLGGNNLLQARIDYLDMNYLYWSQECLKNVLPRVSLP